MSQLFQSAHHRMARGAALLLIGLFLIFLFGPKLVDAPKVDPDHPFNTKATMDRLTRILGDEAPHPVDSVPSDAVIERITDEIRQLGFVPQIDDSFHCSHHWIVSCARIRNIGFWVTEPGPDAVMVASHHDSVPTGPGAADDGMGVASSLEIARLMKDRDLPRPLYILITDGEEVGLVGASYFVQHSPVAPLIGAVVSLEARGNRGPAAMFETSDPNGRDLAALQPHPKDRIKGAVASSLSVDIYRAMPNGTDVTEYLALDMDAANYAMSGHESHYHTHHDDMAHLNPGSVFHVGGSALSAVEGFMTVNAQTSDAPVIYADVMGLTVIALPQALAQPLIGLAFLLCAVALFRQVSERAPLWRSLTFPILALIAGTGFAVLVAMTVNAIRPESAFGTAWPIALRGSLLSASLMAAMLVARWLYQPKWADFYLPAIWAVMMGLGLIASFLFFGTSVLFALPSLFVIPGAILLIVKREGLWAKLTYVLFGLAALLGLALSLTMYVMAETALFVETSAPLTALVIWSFIVFLPLFWRQDGSSRWTLTSVAVTVFAFFAASLIVPAYSEDAPLGRNIMHVAGDGIDGAYYAMSASDPVPATMNSLSPFSRRSIENFNNNLWVTPAPNPQSEPAQIELVRNEQSGDLRTLEFAVKAPAANVVLLSLSGNNPDVQSIRVNDAVIKDRRNIRPRIECTGRRCQDMQIVMELRGAPGELTVGLLSTHYGLDTGADALVTARPDWMVPQHDGDRRIVRRQITVTTPDAR